MDGKSADEFKLEERPDVDADDEFAGPPPDASEEIKTALDDLEESKSDLEREDISAELNTFFETFPDYKVDKLLIRNKKK